MWCCPQTGRNLEGKRMRRHVLRDTVVVFITAGYSGKKCACSFPCLPMARAGHDAVALLSQLPCRCSQGGTDSAVRADTCSRAGGLQQVTAKRSLAPCATGERSATWWRSVHRHPMLGTGRKGQTEASMQMVGSQWRPRNSKCQGAAGSSTRKRTSWACGQLSWTAPTRGRSLCWRPSRSTSSCQWTSRTRSQLSTAA